MNAKAPLAEIANQTIADAWKVTYQFVGNNHALRTNTLVFFAEKPESARTLAESFLKDNNIRYLKIVSTVRA